MAWFFIAGLPTLNFTPLIVEYSLITNAEHFLYVPLIGFLIAVFVLVENYVFPVLKNNQLIKVLLVTVSICNFTVITLQQNTYWKNEVSLFERTVRYENIGRVYSLLGQAYVRDGCYGKALSAFEKGLNIMQSYADKTPVKEAKAFYMMFVRGITLDMANAYAVLQQKDNAVLYYQKALEMDPQDSRLEQFIQTYQSEGK
jgi:tetratricopeptide (TPR) repeat protein